ncbi:hypothetical protein PR048_032176 [Dryococelus australis]|uniref:Uncharacterized protein n=1 Tax=Dryococelus australis TaxID=614101 RepID=A0ABQ9G1G3_9NEOP|nr:hypothetical protein PR048_032176 [Dryococelus australis]
MIRIPTVTCSNRHAGLIAVAQTYCEGVERSLERFYTNPARQAECARPSAPGITAGNTAFVVLTLLQQDVQRWGRAVRRHASSLQPTASWTRARCAVSGTSNRKRGQQRLPAKDAATPPCFTGVAKSRFSYPRPGLKGRAGGNGRSPRKPPAGQRHRPARYPHASIRGIEPGPSRRGMSSLTTAAPLCLSESAWIFSRVRSPQISGARYASRNRRDFFSGLRQGFLSGPSRVVRPWERRAHKKFLRKVNRSGGDGAGRVGGKLANLSAGNSKLPAFTSFPYGTPLCRHLTNGIMMYLVGSFPVSIARMNVVSYLGEKSAGTSLRPCLHSAVPVDEDVSETRRQLRTQLRTEVQFSDCFNLGHMLTWDTVAWNSAMASRASLDHRVTVVLSLPILLTRASTPAERRACSILETCREEEQPCPPPPPPLSASFLSSPDKNTGSRSAAHKVGLQQGRAAARRGIVTQLPPFASCWPARAPGNSSWLLSATLTRCHAATHSRPARIGADLNDEILRAEELERCGYGEVPECTGRGNGRSLGKLADERRLRQFRIEGFRASPESPETAELVRVEPKSSELHIRASQARVVAENQDELGSLSDEVASRFSHVGIGLDDTALAFRCSQFPSPARLLASHQSEPGSIPGRFIQAGECGSAPDDLPFSPPLHSGSAPYSHHFTLIGSQDLDVESPKYLQ